MKKQTKPTAAERRAAEEQRREVACVKLAEAFAAFEEFRGYLPAEAGNAVGDVMAELDTESSWMGDPDMVRAIMPIILSKVLNGEYVPPA